MARTMSGLNEMHVPVNKPVICQISSKDVIHSFRLMAMRVTQDAIPGMRIPIWPNRRGKGGIRFIARSCAATATPGWRAGS